MREETAAILCLGLVFALLTPGCVSPFYGTARIEKGWHMDAGVAATSFVVPSLSSYWPNHYCIGGRGDFTLQYGFNKYFELSGHAGLGLGISIPDSVPSHLEALGEGTIAIQAALPVKYLTPALSLGFSYPSGPQCSVLLGIGQDEKVTLGGRLHFFVEDVVGLVPCVNIFAGVHLKSRWIVFGGYEIFPPIPPVATLGVGFKIK